MVNQSRKRSAGIQCEAFVFVKVEKEDFLMVLEKFDLKLKEEHFNLFLARCGLENSLSGISYMDFLRNFQDRSEKGITHKILSNPKHRSGMKNQL